MEAVSGRDNVALVGSGLGLLSLLPAWFVLSPTRISSGTDLTLAGSVGYAWGGVIAVLWLACLALSLNVSSRLRAGLLGAAANLVLVAGAVLAGLAAARLLAGQPDTARVSLGPGFWVSTAAAYIVIFASRQKLRGALVPQNLVSWAGLAAVLALLGAGWDNGLSIMQELSGRQERFVQESLHHVYLVGVSVAAAAVVGVLLGIWASRGARAEKPVFGVVNVVQSIPSLALFGFLIAPLSALSFAYPVLREAGIRGVGDTPAIIALVVYSLLPVLRNTFAGLRQIDPAIAGAAAGMGMSRGRVLLKVELPLAAPVILDGVRTAAVQAVGLAVVAALIGAGGLGWFVFQGLGQAATDLILLGAIPVIFLALIVDGLLRAAARVARPKGLVEVGA